MDPAFPAGNRPRQCQRRAISHQGALPVNAALRQYVVDHHYMDTLAFHAIPGSMIIDKFGYRECPKK
jgi:hypothetical protein